MMVPTREEVLKFVVDLIEGKEKHPFQPNLVYKKLRETHGKNRSPELDKMILRQGGNLGEPWCLYILQDILDCIRVHYNCVVRIPEGGGTQDFYESIAPKYKKPLATPLSIGIYVNDDMVHGHAVFCLSYFDEHMIFNTFEGNTSAETSDLIRDGEGAYYRTREVSYPNKKLRGFVDIYAAMRFRDV